MKKLLILISCLTFNYTLIAQQEKFVESLESIIDVEQISALITNNEDLLTSRSQYRPYLNELVHIDTLIYLYDDLGYLMNVTALRRDLSTDEWAHTYRIFYEHDTNGNRTIRNRQYWIDEEWVENNKFIYEYNDNNKLTYELNYEAIDGVLFNDIQYFHVYNDNDELVEILRQDFENEEWVNNKKSNFKYNAEGLQIEEMKYEWNQTAWDSLFKIVYEYDERGNRIFDETLILTDGVWNPRFRHKRNFDDQNNLIRYTYETTLSEPEYQFEALYESFYNSDNIFIKEIKSTWEGNNWTFDSQQTIEYDDQGNQIYQLIEDWDPAIESWVNDRTHKREFNDRDNVTSFSRDDWSVETESWEPYFKYYYYYDLTSSSHDVFFDQKFSIIPNPNDGLFELTFKDQDAIMNLNIEVYSIDGRKVYDQTLDNLINIDLSHLNAGYYNLKINSEKGISVQPFIIKK